MLRKVIIVSAIVAIGFAPAQLHAQTSEKDIVATAIEAGSFTTLATALQAADLVSVLQGDGPFTVFAPTDEAFSKLPAGTVEALLADKEALTRILTYHVVPGRVTSEAVMNIGAAETVAGLEAQIEVKMGEVYVAGAKIIAADVEASNGVIHVVDAVMMPPEM